MSFLRQRCRQPEIMDLPGLDLEKHRLALRGLERFNSFSGSAGVLWPSLLELLQQRSRRLRVLDVATGAGDVCIRLWQRARRAGYSLDIHGCDVSPTAIEYARQRAAQLEADVRFFTHDALKGDLPEGYDVIISSLFLHHLEETQAVDLLASMGRAAGEMVMINDLRRCLVGYLVAYACTRLLSRSEVTHIDGPRSVEGAFTIAEATALAERAGLHDATATKCWPFRYLLLWRHGPVAKVEMPKHEHYCNG